MSEIKLSFKGKKGIIYHGFKTSYTFPLKNEPMLTYRIEMSKTFKEDLDLRHNECMNSSS